MPRGFITLHRSGQRALSGEGLGSVRVAVSTIAWWERRAWSGGQHTIVTLTTVHDGQSECLYVQETEEEIEALVEATQAVAA